MRQILKYLLFIFFNQWLCNWSPSGIKWKLVAATLPPCESSLVALNLLDTQDKHKGSRKLLHLTQQAWSSCSNVLLVGFSYIRRKPTTATTPLLLPQGHIKRSWWILGGFIQTVAVAAFRRAPIVLSGINWRSQCGLGGGEVSPAPAV